MWHDIPGYEGLYQVTDDGRVRSLPHPISYVGRWGGVNGIAPGKELAGGLSKEGYPVVVLMNNGARRKYEIHRLMALALLGEPNGRQVHHRNGIRNDNRLENLEYKTPKQHHGDHHRGVRNARAKLTEDDVREIRRLLRQGLRQVDIAARFGVAQTQISSIKRGETWSNVT